MIGFLGAGRVGAQAALEVASAGIDDVALVDIMPGLAEGEAMDISQKIAETGLDGLLLPARGEGRRDNRGPGSKARDD